MADPAEKPPKSNGGSNDKKRGDSQKNSEKGPSSSTFWYLMIGGVILAVCLFAYNENNNGEKLVYSDFVSDVRSGKLNKTNVHEFTIGRDYLRFRNLPKIDDRKSGSKAEATTDENGEKLLRYYIPADNIPGEEIEKLTTLLDEKGIKHDFATPQAELQTLLGLAIMIMFIVFIIMIMRRMSGAGSAMSFGRSRGKLYAQEDVKTTFADVAGIDEAVEELREIVEFLRTPAKYQSLGGRIPKGVLLVGPPGTGKTLLAKAVAGEAGVPFFSLSGSDFVEMFVGVGAARVRDMFSQAVQKSPAIIFIDELDALGKARGSGMPGGHDEREQTLNALLVEMDGFSSDQSVIVMGATNRPETLDPALMRPGRFDRNVLVDKPDYKGREAILKVHAVKVKMDDTVEFQKLARLTPGFSGADLASLVNEAALLAARRGLNAVGMSEFEEGIERVVAGLEKSTRIITPDEKQRVAYHECGHALVACVLPQTDPVHKISIIPRGLGALGYTLQRPQDDRYLVTQTELENRICVLLGGIGTEQLIYEETSTGAQNDLERATDIARRMVTEFGMSPKMGRVNYSTQSRSPFLAGASTSNDYLNSEQTIREIDQEVKRIVDECMDTVLDILQSEREVLEHMTRELIELEVMDAVRLDEILQEHRTGPQLKPGTFVNKPSQPPQHRSENSADEDDSTGSNFSGA